MKKTKKLLSFILSLALIMSCLPSVASADVTYVTATDGYYWLEAESSTSISGGYQHTPSNTIFSGGTAKVAYIGSDPAVGKGFFIDFYINVEETKEYDIFNYGGKVGHDWASAGKIKIDGTPIENQPTAIGGETWCGGGANVPFAWNKTTVEIPEGEHMLTYYIDTKAPLSTTTYIGGLDVICVVPTSYGYTPSGNGATAAKPVAPETPDEPEDNDPYVSATDGYYWLEAEESTSISGGYQYNFTDAAFSGGKAKGLQIGSDPAVGKGFFIDFYINVEETTEYDIFNYGGKVGHEWVSDGKIKIDGTPIANQPTAITAETWLGNPSKPFAWNKTTVEIPAGEHILTYYIDTKPSASTTAYMGGLDVVCVVPSSYEYTPSGNGATAAKPVAPEEPEEPVVPEEPEDTNTYVAATDGYYWLEAESSPRISGGYMYNLTGDLWSGSAAKGICWGSAPAERGFFIDYYIDVEETKEYDIWVFGGKNGDTWASDGKIKIDDVAVSTQPTLVYDRGWNTASYSFPIGWSKTTVEIPAGNHMITYYIDSTCPGSAGATYQGGLDVMCIVPSSYDYDPGNVNGGVAAKPTIPTTPEEPDVPEVTTQNYVWFEETDKTGGGAGMDPVATHADNTAALSADSAMRTSTTSGTAGQYYLEFAYEAETAGEYDIYYRASGNNQWMSPTEISVDGTVYPSTFVREDGWIRNMWNIAWFKTTVNLTGEQQSIKWAISQAISNGTWIGLFDAMFIVPKGTQVEITSDPAAVKADLELATLLSNYDLTAVSENLDLPLTTANGETVTWESNNSSVITKDGVITRSEFADLTASLTATVGNKTKTFTITVKSEREFDVSGFSKRGIIAAGNTLNASATVKYNKGDSKDVILVIALYAANGELIGLNVDKQSATPVGTTLSASLTIPSDYTGDLTGAYTKAFLWNSVDDLRPIVEAL